jgi:P27 family predicted phage terminase small subunit
LAPACPAILDEGARAKWDQLCPLLEEAGVLTQIDGDALANYCMAWSRLLKATALADKSLPVMKDIRGRLCASPLTAIVQKEALLINRLGVELGLTPSSRSRLTAPDAADNAFEFFGY